MKLGRHLVIGGIGLAVAGYGLANGINDFVWAGGIAVVATVVAYFRSDESDDGGFWVTLGGDGDGGDGGGGGD